MWNTNPLLKKRLSYSSNDCMDLFNKKQLHKYSIPIESTELSKEDNSNSSNLKKNDFITKLKNMDYSKTNKKFLEDIFTDFNTVHFFNSLISRLRFIKLVIYTFNEFFKVIYQKDTRFNANNLNLMFKGGTVIRFILTEYMRGFSKNIQDFIKHDIKKNIKMSDYDFEFMSSSNISQDDFIQLNMLIYLVTILIRNNLYRNRHFMFDFFQLSEKTQIKKIKEVKCKLQKEIDHNSKNMVDNNLFKNINIQYIDFIGCSNNILISPKPKDSNILTRYKSINNTHNHQYCKKDYGIIADGSNLSTDKLHLIQAMDLLQLYKIPDDIIKNIIYPYKSFNKDEPGRNIYNRFIATHNPLVENSDDPNNIIKFQLNRIKYIYNIYFSKEININGNKQTLYIKFPLLGEILDLSHAYLADRKKNKFTIDFNRNQYFQQYSFLNYQLDFYSYSVIGLIADLDSIIFDETHYQPWNDIKYAKRLKRILYLYIFYLFSNEINDEYNNKVLDLQLLVQLCGNNFKQFDRNLFNIKKSNVFNRLIEALYKTSHNKKQPQYKQYKIDLMECLNNLLLIFKAQKTTSKQFQLNIGYLSNQLLNIEFPSLY